jgi:hypothetical protein
LLLRKPRNSGFILVCTLLAVLVLAVPVTDVIAYDFGYDGDKLTGNRNDPICGGDGITGLTKRIVPCVKETIIDAVDQFLVPFSEFFADVIAAFCTLAIAIGGYWVASGRTNAALRDMSVLFMKVGFVGIFSYNFGDMFGYFLDIIEELAAIGSSFGIALDDINSHEACKPLFTPSIPKLWLWENVDCALETLVGGLTDPKTLFSGIAGFLVAAFISTTDGMFIGMILFYVVLQLVFALARAMYIYISACIAFAIMILFSPMFVPCILMRATKPYFDKWLRLTVSFMLQPMIVFAYISMLLGAWNIVVFKGPDSVFRTIAGDDVVNDPDFTIGAWMDKKGMYARSHVGGEAMHINPRQVMTNFGVPEKAQTGTAGQIGTTFVGSVDDWRNGIYKKMGITNKKLNYFRVAWPTKPVNWNKLAHYHGLATDGPDGITGNGDDDRSAFMIKLLTSCFMAVVVTYIFMVLLDALPFLSAGLAGVPGGGMPSLGFGQLAPPGSSLMDSFKSKMTNLVKSGGSR